MATPNKRAFVEVQFNWVFVLIVGAIILIFFISIVNSQKKQSDKNLAFDVLSNIDLIMSGGLTVPKTGQLFDMPKLEFDFDCNMLSVFGVTRQFPDKIVFAPNLLKGNKLVVWSQDWNVPFKAANFLYLTTSDVRYIFVGADSQDFADFYDNLPNMTKDKVALAELGTLTDKNNYKIRIVYFGSTPSALPANSFILGMNDKDVTAVSIDLANMKFRFYVKDGNNFMPSGNPNAYYYYLTAPEIYGAVFAENEQIYNCSMQKAFTKLQFIARIYSMREDALAHAQEYQGTICPGLRTKDKMDLIAQKSEIESVFIYGDEMNQIKTQMTNIEASNQNNLENSCPSIY